MSAQHPAQQHSAQHPVESRQPATSSDLTLAALIRELQLANQRTDEAERFAINFTALAPFARPRELPPLARFTRQAANPHPPLPLQRSRSTQRRPRWAPPPSTPHPRSPHDEE